MNQLLLWVGDAVAVILQFLGDGASWVGGTLDAVIAPVLSPLLALLNPIAGAVGKPTFALLSILPKWASLTVLSALVGVAMLYVFKYLSNQSAIARAKDDISANLLVLKLYKDELRVTAISQVRLLRAVLRLQRYVLTPVLISLPPMLLMLGQMGTYYQWEPLAVNRTVLLRVMINSRTDERETLTLDAGESVRVDAGPIASRTDVVWRITPTEAGDHTLTVTAGDESYSKVLTCGEAATRISAFRPGQSWTSQLLHPLETPLPGEAAIQGIELDYAKAASWYCGGDYWVLSFFVVSMIAALILKPVVGVRF